MICDACDACSFHFLDNGYTTALAVSTTYLLSPRDAKEEALMHLLRQSMGWATLLNRNKKAYTEGGV